MVLIDNLLTLYKVDRQVRSLRNRVESAQIYLNVQKKQMGTIEVEKTENDIQRKQRKANIANIETEIGSIDARIEHLREDLNKAVNDKQYSALLAEMNTIKEHRKAFEDEELIEMGVVEELDQISSDIEQRKTEREKVLQVSEKELETRKSEISNQLTELEKERDGAAEVIPESILDEFDSLADDYEGEALAAIEIIDLKRHEYSCTSCSLRLPLDAITSLLGNREEIIKCVSCNRILYLEAESREAIAPAEK
jgi:predicted  nucleic acid-binding Zn-ribbon protein|tara:strand:+ start:247 stop:1005 length:759 start_codon:yes stop_codon:yes gene_type:complete